MHTSTLRALGGSMAVTLPAPLIKSLGFSVGENFAVTAQAGGIYLSPISRKKYSARDLVAMQGKTPVLIDSAWNDMPAMGNEAPL